MRLKIFMAVVGTAATLAVVSFVILREPTNDPIVEKQQDSTTTSEQVIELEGNYLFSGTVVLARGVERLAVDASGRPDYAQPFSALQSFAPETYDAWGVDFECPITSTVIPYQEQIDRLVFNCPPAFLPEMTKYFSLYNLANNHTGDIRGADGFAETRENLAAAGVQFYGNFDPTITEDICEIIALPARQDNETKVIVPIAFCGLHLFNYDRAPRAEELAEISKYAAQFPVFAFVEMGVEYRASASSEQEQIARSVIDAGADFVLANNPHWVQNAEVYKGKLIVYSLGNFIFDQLEPETLRGVSIAVSMRIANFSPAWQSLSTSCRPEQFKDTCLEQARELGVSKVTPIYTFSPIANTSGYRVVTERADATVQRAIEDRLGWDAVSEALGQN